MNKPHWRIALWLLMVVVVLSIGWQARWVLFPFAIGALLAYVLTPLVDRMAPLIPNYSHQKNVVRRGFAVLLMYMVLLLGFVGIGLMVVPIAIDQAVELIDEFPEQRMQAQDQVNEWLEVYRERVPEDARTRIDDFVVNLGDDINTRLAEQSASTFDILTTTLGVVFGFLVVPIWMFYALRDRHVFERNFQAAIPIEVRPDILNVVRIADNLLGRYLRGQIFLGVVVGISIFIGLTILDVELSIALAIFAGLTELIPIVGPWIGAVPALVLVAASGDLDKILLVALLYFMVQQVENNLLVPRIQGHAVDLHPAVIILLLVVAGTVFGFVGLLLIVPLTALFRELFWYADYRMGGSNPEEALGSTHVARRFNLVANSSSDEVATALSESAVSPNEPRATDVQVTSDIAENSP